MPLYGDGVLVLFSYRAYGRYLVMGLSLALIGDVLLSLALLGDILLSLALLGDVLLSLALLGDVLLSLALLGDVLHTFEMGCFIVFCKRVFRHYVAIGCIGINST